MSDSRTPAAPLPARDYLALVILAALASALMFYQLGQRYLWQDEAATAVLAERMLDYGRPLGFDGRNLITMDFTSQSSAQGFQRRIRDEEAMLRFYVERGDFKPDTTWIGQPWGQFVMAAASLGAFGHGTWQARAPFALCGVLAVLVLYVFVRRRFDDPLCAWLAALLLLANVFWVLHMRQCRYYAPSSLFLLLTVITYLRFQDARRAGAALFVITAWLWFQCDYGTFFPVIGILAIDSLARRRRMIPISLATFAALAVAITPWVLYYELIARVKETPVPFYTRALLLYFYFNQYLFPVVLIPVAAWLYWRSRRALPIERRQALGVSAAIVASQLLWAPIVVPAGHHRYIVAAAPLACLLLAYTVVQLGDVLSGLLGRARARKAIAIVGAALLAITPWISNIALLAFPSDYLPVQQVGGRIPWGVQSDERSPDAESRVDDGGVGGIGGGAKIVYVLRAELVLLFDDLAGRTRDPNRELVELLTPRLRPEDEILINYEDAPLIFYLPNRIRGGIACYRLNPPDAPPPRFIVDNATAQMLYTEAQARTFQAVIKGYPARPVPNDIPNFWTGNCPDPMLYPGQWNDFGALKVFEVVPKQSSPSATGQP